MARDSLLFFSMPRTFRSSIPMTLNLRTISVVALWTASCLTLAIRACSRASLAAEADDAGKGGEAFASSSPAVLFASMLERFATDRLWAAEYEDFVRQVSFADQGELMGFDEALAALRDLVALYAKNVED